MITQERLKTLFKYADGKLIRLVDKGSQKAGTVAGTFNNSDNYRQIAVDGKIYREHRLIFLYHYGYLPEVVDHINQDRIDNRIENLRESDKSRNAVNSDVIISSTGFRGVYKKETKSGSRWVARIKKNYKDIFLGSFLSPEEASEAYIEGKAKYFPGV